MRALVVLLAAMASLQLALATPAASPASAGTVPAKPASQARAADASPAATPATADPSSAQQAAAAPASPSDASPPADDGPREWVHGEGINWTKQIATTLVWLVLMCGGIWLILRFMYGRMGISGFGSRGRCHIQVLDRCVLGPQKALMVVAVPGKFLLLGMTEQSITTLTELHGEDIETLSAPARPPFGARVQADRAPTFEPPPDNLVDLAGLFGRRAAQTTKGEDQE